MDQQDDSNWSLFSLPMEILEVVVRELDYRDKLRNKAARQLVDAFFPPLKGTVDARKQNSIAALESGQCQPKRLVILMPTNGPQGLSVAGYEDMGRGTLNQLTDLRELLLCSLDATMLPRLLGGIVNGRRTIHTLWLVFKEPRVNADTPLTLERLTALTDLAMSSVSMDAAWPIGRLTSLRQLTLSLCNPSEAPCSLPESLWQLPNLHTLELVDPHGATNHLPGNKPTAAKLQQLSINMEQLKSLPDTRGHLGDLTRLRIKHGPFEQLPAQFTQLSSLRDLELDNCMVDSLILRDGLTALERLSLETSYDHEHQHDLGLLTRFSNIQSLHIGDVSPDNIQFGAHSALTSLKISNCLEITELPASLGNLGHLRELELDANLNLGGLPEVVSRLTALTALSVSLCGSFDMQSTTILTSLRTLVLELNSGVDDDNVPVPPLGQFRLLRELFVRDGTVELTFDRLTNLTSLFLEASEIVGDVPALARLPQLRKVSCLLTSSTTNQFSSMLTGATAITDLELATSGVQSPLLPAIATLTSLRRLGLFFSHDIHHAEGWPASMTNLSQLTRLTIYSNNIPRLPEVTMLQRLRILHMPKSMMLCGPVTRLGRLECIVGGRHSPEDAEHMQAAEELVRKGVARRQG